MEIVLAMLTGLVYVVSPGPVNVETLRRGWTNGFQGALLLQMGALVGDMVYAVLAWAGIGFFMMNSSAQTLLGATGATMLVYLGGSSLYQDWNKTALGEQKLVSAAEHTPTNVSSTLPNPALPNLTYEHELTQEAKNQHAIVSTTDCVNYTLDQTPETTLKHSIFESIKSLWIGIILAIANPYGIVFWLSVESAVLQHTQYKAISFLSGFFLGGALASLCLSLLAAYLGSLKTARIFRLVSRILGIVLIGFGLILGYKVVLGA